MRTEKRKTMETPPANEAEASQEEGMLLNQEANFSEPVFPQEENRNPSLPTPAAENCTESEAIPTSVNDSSPEAAENKEVHELKRRKSDSKMKRGATSHAWKCICCTESTNEKPKMSDAKKIAIARGEELRASLDPSLPSCVKPMSRHNVTGLGGTFSRAHLPHADVDLTLVDELGVEFPVKYITQKAALSGGWRHFSLSHTLVEDDVLVFQLIDPLKLKVYIIRAHEMAEMDGALGLLNLDGSKEAERANETEEDREAAMRQCNTKRRKRTKAFDDVSEQSEATVEPVKDEPNHDSCLAGVPDDVRAKYKTLCEAQGASLHASLVENLNDKLIAGLITEVVQVADGIRKSTMSMAREEYARWERTLGALEMLGMKVGFLRGRCEGLVQVAYGSEGSGDARRFAAAAREVESVAAAMEEIEGKVRELAAERAKCQTEIEEIHLKAHKYEAHFRNEVVKNW